MKRLIFYFFFIILVCYGSTASALLLNTPIDFHRSISQGALFFDYDCTHLSGSAQVSCNNNNDIMIWRDDVQVGGGQTSNVSYSDANGSFSNEVTPWANHGSISNTNGWFALSSGYHRDEIYFQTSSTNPVSVDFTFSLDIEFINVTTNSTYAQFELWSGYDNGLLGGGPDALLDSEIFYNDYNGSITLSTGWFAENNGYLPVSAGVYAQIGNEEQSASIDWMHTLSLREVNVYELIGTNRILLDTSQFSLLSQDLNAAIQPVPEPATMLLFGTGLVGLTVARLRRRK